MLIAIDPFSLKGLALPLEVGLALLFVLGIYALLQWQISQRRRAENLLRQQTDRERLVTEIAQQIRRSLNVDEVLATTVGEVQRFLQTDRVLLYRLWDDGTGSAIHEAVLPLYPSVLGQRFPAEVFPSEYHQAYSLGKTRTIANIEQTDVESCLAEFVKQFGVQAKLVVPIIQRDRSDAEGVYLWGLLIAHHCRGPRVWAAWEVELMTQLATQVAIAIQQSELYNQLQQMNAQLELRVQQRTAELAAANVSLRAEIVERQRTEAALRHMNDMLQALVTASPRAIVMLDREGRVKIWNPAAEQMFGWTEAEVLDQPNPIGFSDQHPDYPTLQTSVLQGTIYSRLEFQQRRKDGNEIDIVFSVAPLPDNGGQVSGIVAVITDVTEEKQQAEQLRRLDEIRLALEREKELSALKTRFFSMASHEFRTPLSTALAAAQVLENSQAEWDNTEKRLRNLHRIQDSVRHMVQLLDDILTINRAETGKLAVNLRPLDLEVYCRNFVEEMQLNASTLHRLVFTCEGQSGLISLDEKLLRSMLSNLLSNAINYSPQGGTVLLALEFRSGSVMLRVQDEGIGIPVEDQDQLFEPFYRGRNVRAISGTGLGLVVVKKGVELHQGTIEIRSTVGAGTVCEIVLPAK
jgi:PAS domain S-box-containing protein